jgi:hypothetical protein
MHPRSTRGLLASAAFMATLALPSAASSQYRLPTITSVVSADSVHASALAVTDDSRRWRDAARLHRQSAALRVPGDTLGYRCLMTAANLSYGANDLASAQIDMAAAAAQAMARGDVEKAAQAYADAAWLANERKRPDDVRTFVSQAEVLASSPLLSGAQRNQILRRFVHTGPTGPELAAEVTR